MAKYKVIRKLDGKEDSIKSKGKVKYFRTKSAARAFMKPKVSELDFDKMFGMKSKYRVRKV